ncbi:MAG: transketolase, partial [Bdellovibrionales bacterium]|nr:transketolase [Bdellovibrionales bacterium]
SSSEAEALMYEAIKTFANEREKGLTPNSTIFFLGRENHPVSYVEGLEYKWNKANVLIDGSDVTIVAAGPMVGKALAAQKELAATGIKACVVNHSHINHVDVETLRSCLSKTKGKLITIEDHQVIAGMGAMILHALHTNGVDFKAKTLGIGGEFGQSAYKADQLYARFDLSSAGIVKAYHSLNS